MSAAVRLLASNMSIPELPLPPEWTPVLDAWPSTTAPTGVVDSIRAARTGGLLAESGRYAEFADVLRTALAGDARSVVVTHTNPKQVVEVVSLVGALLGDVTYPTSPVLGGPASAVPTGGVDRYEQAWHTDSTPWVVPNRYSVLGLLRGDSALENAETCVLPWSTIDHEWCAEPALDEELRKHLFSWRDNYPSLPELSAPIQGDMPRWFRPALADLIDDPVRRVEACRAVDNALLRVTSWYEAEVAPGRVLVFDNHEALHRGPAVPGPSTRTLLRLKVDGTPER